MAEIYSILSVRRLAELTSHSKDEIKVLHRLGNSLYSSFDTWSSKGKCRHIDNPAPPLKKFQRMLVSKVLNKYEFPEYVVGGVHGRSILDALAPHVRKESVVTIDLKDCFPRISDFSVFNVMRSKLKCSEEISQILTALTTVRHYLPQGAPTSPVVANLALLDLYAAIYGCAQGASLDFSTYVDDLIFSGDDAPRIIEPVIKLIRSHGHVPGKEKIKIFRSGVRQEVLKHTVNRKISLGREKIAGYRKVMSSVAAKGVATKTDLARIAGIVDYSSTINKEQGEALRRLADKVKENIQMIEGQEIKATDRQEHCESGKKCQAGIYRFRWRAKRSPREQRL